MKKKGRCVVGGELGLFFFGGVKSVEEFVLGRCKTTSLYRRYSIYAQYARARVIRLRRTNKKCV